MTIQHTGNKNTKPLNVSPNLTTGLPSTDIARYSTVLLSTLLICAYSHLSWFWSLVLDSSRSVLETMEKKEQMQFLMNLLQTRQDTKEKRFVEPLLICKSPHNTHSFLFSMIIPIEEKQLTQNVCWLFSLHARYSCEILAPLSLFWCDEYAVIKLFDCVDYLILLSMKFTCIIVIWCLICRDSFSFL